MVERSGELDSSDNDDRMSEPCEGDGDKKKLIGVDNAESVFFVRVDVLGVDNKDGFSFGPDGLIALSSPVRTDLRKKK